jgi:hypothetical protein
MWIPSELFGFTSIYVIIHWIDAIMNELRIEVETWNKILLDWCQLERQHHVNWFIESFLNSSLSSSTMTCRGWGEMELEMEIEIETRWDNEININSWFFSVIWICSYQSHLGIEECDGYMDLFNNWNSTYGNHLTFLSICEFHMYETQVNIYNGNDWRN